MILYLIFYNFQMGLEHLQILSNKFAVNLRCSQSLELDEPFLAMFLGHFLTALLDDQFLKVWLKKKFTDF